MASSELESVIQLLRSNNPIQGDTIEAMRSSLDAAVGGLELPPGVESEIVDVGGVRAEWTAAPGADSARAVVYFHGGGYTLGSIQSHRPLVTKLSQAAGARVLNVGYRLGPEHPYPAAVEDAVAAYRFVLDSGVPSGRTAIAGDSAGGGLTAACLVALRDAGLPLPAAAVCISPWLDLSFSGESLRSKADVDPLVDRASLQLMADAYLAGADPRAPTASPLFAELAGLPPMLLHVGSREILLDDSTRFAERARAAGVDVELEVWEDMIHVWHSFADLLPEGREAIQRIGAYLGERLR